MKLANRIVGLFLLAGVAFYVYSLWAQSKGIKDVCAAHPEGAELGDPNDLADEYSIRYMGSFEVEDSPGVDRHIFCAPLTMCDASCSLYVKDGIVTQADYTAH